MALTNALCFQLRAGHQNAINITLIHIIESANVASTSALYFYPKNIGWPKYNRHDITYRSEHKRSIYKSSVLIAQKGNP